MLGAGVDLQLLDLGAREAVAGEHPLDGLAQHLGRPALELVAQRPALEPARVARVAVVHLRVELVAGDVDLLRVHDDDEVAGVDVRRVLRLALAAQRVGDLRSQTPQRLSFGVDEVPAALDFTGLCVPGLHSCLDREAADCCPPARKCTNDHVTGSASGAGGAAGERDPERGERNGDRAADRDAVSAGVGIGQAAEQGERGAGRAGEQVVEADQPPTLGRQREVDQLGGRGDVREAPAEAEPEQRDAGGEDAHRPGEPERRDGHHREPADERDAAAEPVDQVADDEHEPVHADDVRADHREDVGLHVALADHHVAGQVHHGDHHREARRARRRSAVGTPGRRRISRSGAGGCRRRCPGSERAILPGSGRTASTSAEPDRP